MGLTVLRKEKFGGILFDFDSGKITYLNKVDYKRLSLGKDIKLVKNPDYKYSFLNSPESFGIDITQKCNLACPQCYKNSGGRDENELTKKEIFSLINQASDAGIFNLFISGGEPTCREDLFEIIDYAYKKNIRCILTTNGVYGKDILDKIIASRPLYVQISLDGPKDVHDKIRGEGNFERSINSIRYLSSKGIKVNITNHLCGPNKDFVEDLVKVASDLKVSVKFSLMRPIGRNKLDVVDVLKGKEVYKVVKNIIFLKKKYPLTRISSDFDKTLLDEPVQCFSGIEFVNCMAGEKTITIDSIGRVFPCSFLTPFMELYSGNLREKKLMGIWRQSKVLKEFRARKVSKECQSCSKYKKSCLAGCPAVSLASKGSVSALDPMCPVESTKLVVK
jgi:radical SAM protein with 4Fe4S-binding SPASM domain